MEELARAARAMTGALTDKWEAKAALNAVQRRRKPGSAPSVALALARGRFEVAAAACGVDDFPALGAWIASRAGDEASALRLLTSAVLPELRTRFVELTRSGVGTRDAYNGIARRIRAALLKALEECVNGAMPPQLPLAPASTSASNGVTSEAVTAASDPTTRVAAAHADLGTVVAEVCSITAAVTALGLTTGVTTPSSTVAVDELNAAAHHLGTAMAKLRAAGELLAEYDAAPHVGQQQEGKQPCKMVMAISSVSTTMSATVATAVPGTQHLQRADGAASAACMPVPAQVATSRLHLVEGVDEITSSRLVSPIPRQRPVAFASPAAPDQPIAAIPRTSGRRLRLRRKPDYVYSGRR
jgi:hypothetical protein